MTTPERIRRRQRREQWFIAVLALALVAGVIYFRNRQDTTVACVVQYAQSQSDSQRIRSGLVSRESQAVRRVILGVRDVDTREEYRALFDRYERSLHRIDSGRRRHPVPEFDLQACTS